MDTFPESSALLPMDTISKCPQAKFSSPPLLVDHHSAMPRISPLIPDRLMPLPILPWNQFCPHQNSSHRLLWEVCQGGRQQRGGKPLWIHNSYKMCFIGYTVYLPHLLCLARQSHQGRNTAVQVDEGKLLGLRWDSFDGKIMRRLQLHASWILFHLLSPK